MERPCPDNLPDTFGVSPESTKAHILPISSSLLLLAFARFTLAFLLWNWRLRHRCSGRSWLLLLRGWLLLMLVMCLIHVNLALWEKLEWRCLLWVCNHGCGGWQHRLHRLLINRLLVHRLLHWRCSVCGRGSICRRELESWLRSCICSRCGVCWRGRICHWWGRIRRWGRIRLWGRIRCWGRIRLWGRIRCRITWLDERHCVLSELPVQSRQY